MARSWGSHLCRLFWAASACRPRFSPKLLQEALVGLQGWRLVGALATVAEVRREP